MNFKLSNQSLAQSIGSGLEFIRDQHRYRRRRSLSGPQGPHVVLDGKRLLNFSSNDYLGLANDSRVVEAFKQASDEYGVGSGASHLVCGHSAAHEQLESALADFTGRDRALLFANGYSANMAAIRALVTTGDTVFQDRLNHASLLDGAWLSRAQVQWFEHRHYTQLQQLLTQNESENSEACRLIVSDGVFSMDGDCCDLPTLVHLAQSHKAWLMIDDAHGFGVLGEGGQGLVDSTRYTQEQVPVLVGTLGKAFGTSGAFVAGSEALIEWLIQKARNYIYSTAMPSAIAVATLTSLQLARTETWRRDHLHSLIERFVNGARELELPLLPSSTPIQPLLLKTSERCLRVSSALEQQGIFACAIRPPTVPADAARIRIALSASHSEQDVDYLLSTLKAVIDV